MLLSLRKIKNSASNLSLLAFFLFSPTLHAKPGDDLVDFKNPTPSFSELNLNLHYLAEIIGKGQLIVQHKERAIDLWTQGTVKHYEGVRFSSAMTIIDAPADVVRKKVLDTKAYNEFMPQIRDEEITIQEDKRFITHFTQQYNMGPIPIKARFIWQYQLEANGDVSLLMHDGDVDASAARFEFLKINEKQTLLVHTAWQDVSTAKFTYRVISKANEDVRTFFPAVAVVMVILQYRDAFGPALTPPEKLPSEPSIPVLTNNPKHLATLIQLAKNGTIVIIHEKQWYQDANNNNKQQPIFFASAVRLIPAKLEEAKPIILDMTSLKEFTKEIKDVEVTPIENGNHVEAKMKIGLGVIGLSVDFYFDLMDYPQSENVRMLLNGGGDMYPMLGAYEFSGYQENGTDFTFGVLTQGGSISDSAPYMLRLISNKVPQFEYIRSIFSTLPQIEKQQNWVMEQLEKQTTAK